MSIERDIVELRQRIKQLEIATDTGISEDMAGGRDCHAFTGMTDSQKDFLVSLCPATHYMEMRSTPYHYVNEQRCPPFWSVAFMKKV